MDRAKMQTMSLAELLELMKQQSRSGDQEVAHVIADDILLELCNRLGWLLRETGKDGSGDRVFSILAEYDRVKK